MKSKSLLFFLAGIAIGGIAGVLFAPEKSLKKKKGPVKKLTAKKSLKQTASKYEKELTDMDKKATSKKAKTKPTGSANI